MTYTTNQTHRNRRNFLGLMGKLGVTSSLCRAAPLLGGLVATRHAHAMGEVKRVVFVYTPNGAPNGLWLPSGQTLNVATQAFEGLQSICNFREVEVIGSGHGLTRKCLGALRWTQDWTSDTIDQQIASVIGTQTPYASYTLGVQTNGVDLISRKSGALVPSQDNPSVAYQQLFGSAPPVGDTAGFLARKRSVMDVNRAALNEMKTRLGSFERELIDKHEVALAEIEARLVDSTTTQPSEECTSPAWNANNYPTTGGVDVPFAHQSELQSDIIVAAMQCGLTNVMTLQLGWHQGEWYAHDTNFRGNHHNSCHSAGAPEHAEMTNYLSRCIAYLVRRLVEEDDPAAPGTKMIDNTVVVQVTDMGDGQDHTAPNGPNMVATRMPSFKRGTVSRGGNHYMVLEAVAEGLGLRPYMGKDVRNHQIWPCADGQVAGELLA